MPSGLIIFNPASKNGARVASQVRKRLELARPEGLPLEWIPIQELSRASLKPDRAMVIGGDGSISGAVEWLDREGLTCPLGIIPAGTGNNLARGLGLPLETREALALALEGQRRRSLDAIRYSMKGSGDRPRLLVQSAALGFPAEIAAQYDALRRHRVFRYLCAPAGPYVYRVLAFLGLAGQKRKERLGTNLLDVECAMPGETLRETVFAIFIGNERSLGGNFIPCAKAKLDDGALDICLIRARTGAKYLDLFRSIIRGEHLALERTVVYRQTRGPLTIKLSQPCAFLADGDLWVKGNELELEVLPGRFQVVVP